MDSGATDAPPTDTSTATPDPFDCPYVLEADPATDDQKERIDRRIDYEDLDAARQSEFDRMLNGATEVESLPERWASPVLVNYRGAEYYVVASTC
ncbi:hypothetical protein C475_04014 [Halosimplex carlsbadense 2-9-1]|uniref:DUF7979 domain-containing protein n=2 Tax=Halosimplex carlsbadense TaxID=171164 RepID=M0D3C3_9EURY|nr:hypothetical protein C475_04014 [Halosimplex carlsbadense 2-9-1]